MTKPRLAKVRALFYVLQQVRKRGCAYFDTAPVYLEAALKSAETKTEKVSVALSSL